MCKSDSSRVAHLTRASQSFAVSDMDTAVSVRVRFIHKGFAAEKQGAAWQQIEGLCGENKA